MRCAACKQAVTRLPQPRLVFDPGGTMAILSEDYAVSAPGVRVRVRAGFRFDGASIPASLQPVLGGPWDPRRLPAATAHDWLYASHAAAKWVADLVFLWLLLRNGFPPVAAIADWWAVARFGGGAWRSHGPDENRRTRPLGGLSLFGLPICQPDKE